MGRCSACETLGRCLARYGEQNLKITPGNRNILPGGCSDEPTHAVANYEQALAALQHLPENPDTMRQAIDLHLTVRVALHPLGAFTQILPHLRAAERLAEALGDPQRLAQGLAYLGNYFTSTCQSAQALEVCQRALVMATRHGDVVLQINAQYRLSRAYFNMGDFRQAIALLTETVESLTGELRYAFLDYSAPLAVVSRYLLVWSLGLRGAFSCGGAADP